MIHPRHRLRGIALEKAIEAAVEEAFWRIQHGPALPGALADAARGVLRGAHIEGARVQVERATGGWALQISLPAGIPPIQTVRLRLDVD